MPRALRLISELFVDLWRWRKSARELRIDLKRVNVELRRAVFVGVEEDALYRERVKQRMREGSRCMHPPLIDRNKVLQFRGTSRVVSKRDSFAVYGVDESAAPLRVDARDVPQ